MKKDSTWGNLSIERVVAGIISFKEKKQRESNE